MAFEKINITVRTKDDIENIIERLYAKLGKTVIVKIWEGYDGIEGMDIKEVEEESGKLLDLGV